MFGARARTGLVTSLEIQNHLSVFLLEAVTAIDEYDHYTISRCVPITANSAIFFIKRKSKIKCAMDINTLMEFYILFCSFINRCLG